jgi:Domain of unknown function (DUF4838)
MKHLVLFLLFLLHFLPSGICVTTINSVLTPTPIPELTEGRFLTSWLLLGPIPLQVQTNPEKSFEHLPGFNIDYLTKLGGEKNLTVKAGDIVKLKKGSVTWKYHQSKDSIINLATSVSKAFPVFAYAYTEVEAANDGIQMIGLGSNDGARLFVNGAEVFDYPASRVVKVDGDLIPVLLKKGKNTLLLKVEQQGNKWGFCLRFLPFSSVDALERGDLFKVTTDPSGVSRVASSYSNELTDNLIQKLDIVLTDIHGKSILSETRTNHFCGVLNINSSNYQPYLANLTVELKSGSILHRKVEFTAGKRREYTLFSGGKSDYRISLSASASESEKWSAKELQHWLKEISGIELPLLTFDPNFAGPQIVIGETEIGAASHHSAVSEESFHYYNVGPNIFLTGGKQRGTLYGVFDFLEKELGCRWYTPTVTVVPRRDELKFVWFDHAEKPGIRVRNDFYFEAFDPIWATRNKMNGTMGYRQQPGGVESYWSVHTFFPLMPPAEFYKKHPEYYSLIDGKRIFERAQLCLTNPDVLSIITERIKKKMRESPEYLIYDVSQNDWYNPCQCDKCQAIVKEKGGESGLIIWFVNQVAEAVEKEFPDKFVGTLAYQYTRTPPINITPRHNVVVRLCSIECCFAHDFKSCPENKSFLDDLRGWSAIAPHMYIWDYVVNFGHYVMPYPNFRVLQSNIQSFRDNHAIGIMEQAAYQSRGGEFSELRAYLISKLLWNPECNTEDVINDFMVGYYGRAGKFVRQYFDLLHNRITPQTHIHLGLTPGDLIFSDEFVRQSCELFKEAARVADNQEILQRVEMCSLPILYLKCRRTPVLARQDGTYADFCRIAKRENVLNYSEAGEVDRKGFHNFVENVKK